VDLLIHADNKRDENMGNIGGVIAAVLFVAVYLMSVLVTGSLWGPFAMVADWVCSEARSGLAACG